MEQNSLAKESMLYLIWDVLAVLQLMGYVAITGLHVGLPDFVSNTEVTFDVFATTFFAADSMLARYLNKKFASTYKEKIMEGISLIPVTSLLYGFGVSATGFFILPLMRLLRGPSLYKRFKNREQEFVMPNGAYYFMAFCAACLILHILSCFWLYFCPFDTETAATGYNMALYWTITTVSTVGYGDITPKTNVGRIFTVAVMFIGVIFYSLVIGQVSRIMTAMDKRKASANEKLDSMAALFRAYEIPNKLQKDVLKFYSHLLTNSLNEQEEKILGDLPTGLRSEIRLHMNVKLIAKASLFKNVSIECLIDAASGLEQIYHNPESPIIKKGEIGEEMYLIAHGSVKVHAGTHLIAVLEQGSCFGEMALIENSPRTADITALAYCDLYRLSKNKFTELMTLHDDLRANANAIVASRQAKPKAA